MKFDAEFLKKFHFWILLAIAVPLVLFALLWLNTSIAGLNAAKKKVITDKKSEVKGQMSGVKNKGDVELALKRESIADERKTIVWELAYENQKDLMTWPEEFEEVFHFQDGFFAKEIHVDRSGSPTGDGKTPENGAIPENGTTPSDTTPPVGGDETQNSQLIKTYEGKIESVYPDWILVEGLKQPIRKTLEVDNPTNPKVFLTNESNKKIYFKDLRPGDKVKVTYEVGKYFGDELTQNEIDFFTDTYKDQIHPLLKIVDPVDTNGEGVVLLGNWGFDEETFPKAGSKFITYVPPDQWKVNPNSSKEAWTAQEDIWIQRELYRLIAKANNYVAECKPTVGGSPAAKVYTFANAYWNLEISLKEKGKLTIKMTNRLGRIQPANVDFKITYRKDRSPLTITVPGGSLRKKQSFIYSEEVRSDVTDILSVQQVLSWETAAVKQIQNITIGSGKRPGSLTSITGEEMAAPGLAVPGIGVPGAEGDQLAMGPGLALSHRNAVKELKSFFKLELPEGAVDPSAEVPFEVEGCGGELGGAPAGEGGEMQGMPIGPSYITKNGFDLKRYVEITPQARRVPVALALVIDQNQVTEVLTAFTNSRLRFLIKQALLNRYPKNISPYKQKYGDPSESFIPGELASEYGEPYPFGPAPGSPYEMDGFESGEEFEDYSSGDISAVDASSSNVELVLYGVVSLYARFPAREQSGAEAIPVE